MRDDLAFAARCRRLVPAVRRCRIDLERSGSRIL